MSGRVQSWTNSSNNRCCIPSFIVLRQIRISRATLQQLSTVVIVSRLFCYVQTLKRFSLTKLLKHNNSNYLRERELKTVRLQVDKPHSGLNLIPTSTVILGSSEMSYSLFLFCVPWVRKLTSAQTLDSFYRVVHQLVKIIRDKNLHIYNLQFIKEGKCFTMLWSVKCRCIDSSASHFLLGEFTLHSLQPLLSTSAWQKFWLHLNKRRLWLVKTALILASDWSREPGVRSTGQQRQHFTSISF